MYCKPADEHVLPHYKIISQIAVTLFFIHFSTIFIMLTRPLHKNTLIPGPPEQNILLVKTYTRQLVDHICSTTILYLTQHYNAARQSSPHQLSNCLHWADTWKPCHLSIIFQVHKLQCHLNVICGHSLVYNFQDQSMPNLFIRIAFVDFICKK